MLLHESLEHSADLYKNKKTALVFDERHLTYGELDSSANSLSQALIEYGISRQDRVVVYLRNSVESVISIYGILKAGGIFVLVNPQVKAAKLAYILKDCQARAIITEPACLAELRDEARPSTIVVAGPEESAQSLESTGEHVRLSFNEVLRKYPPVRPRRSCIDIDLASLIYTSGSTGDPKGVMLTHLNMLSAARSIIQYLSNTSNDIILDVLPLSFDYGLYQVLMSVIFGGTVVLERSFVYPQQLAEALIRHRVTGLPMVPTMVALMLQARSLGQRSFPDLRYITSTGQALPPAHITRLREVFPEAKIFSMYGLTECKRVSYLSPDELDRRPASVGKAIPNTEAYIVDESGIEITQARKPGQLVVRGSHVMVGYWGLPEKTADTLREGRHPGERVLYTGDTFEKDEDGFLYFLGRRDDMFKSSGQLVSPREVEGILHECDGVAEAAVVGVDDELVGQAVVAFVVRKEHSQVSDSDIIGFCSSRLERHLVPRRVVFCASLPRTSTGKIRKSALRGREMEEA